MADQKLDKRSSHGSRSSQTAKQKRITNLKILTEHLQQRLRLDIDLMSMENFMEDIDENKIKVEQDDVKEEILQPNQLRGFLERKKANDRLARDYEYQGRYDGYY